MIQSMTADILNAVRERLQEEPNAFRRDVIDIVAMKLQCHPQTVRHAIQVAVDGHKIIVSGRTCSASLRWVDEPCTDRLDDDRNVVRTKAIDGVMAGPRYIDPIEWGMAHCLGCPPLIKVSLNLEMSA